MMLHMLSGRGRHSFVVMRFMLRCRWPRTRRCCCKSTTFQALHAILDKIHLHVEPVNLIDAISETLKLPGKYI